MVGREEQKQRVVGRALQSAEKGEWFWMELTPEFAAEYLADPVGVRERIRKNAERRASEASD